MQKTVMYCSCTETRAHYAGAFPPHTREHVPCVKVHTVCDARLVLRGTGQTQDQALGVVTSLVSFSMVAGPDAEKVGVER
jgi:methylaspartate ammonia-lyase